MINPIVDWSTADVWEFLRYYGCSSNPLYQCGKNRIGCIGCPLQGFVGMKNDFIKRPKYKELYIKAFDRMIEARRQKGLEVRDTWENGESVMKWWVGDDPRQISLFDDEWEFIL